MAANKAYSLPTTAEEMYTHLSKLRQQVIEKGREMARITIPSVIPPDGYQTGDNISEENQSVGALCVNTLASKLQYMALPPDRPIMRFQPVEHRLRDQIAKEPALWTMVEIALSRLEIEHRQRLETTNIRSAYVGAMKLLLIGGNCLWEHMKLDFPVVHGPINYVVRRNTRGEQLLAILKRPTDMMDLDDDVKEMVYRLTPTLSATAKEWETTIDIYAVCKRCRDGNGSYYWEYWEEYKGEVIPGSEFEADFEQPPLYAAWMVPVYGQNWGRSYCEEYQGDLYKVEGLEAALNDGAALASLVLLFLKAGARTSIKQIKAAQNLSVLPGSGEDLSAFKLDKGQDFQFINVTNEAAIKRLGRAFLLVSSVQRKGERVTAEEIQELTGEIEQATGGLYSEIAQSFQRHVIRRAVALHNDEDKGLPKFPEGLIRVAVVTGAEALGRTIEGQNLVRAIGTANALFPEKAQLYIKPGDAIRRIFTSESVKQDGLIATDGEVEETIQGEMDKRKQLEMVSKGTGPAINAMAAMGPAAMQAAQEQQAAGEDPTANPPTTPPQAP